MANYSNLKTAIENAVDWNNGDNEITGQNLLDILETIIDSLGAKYKFADVATPSSSITTPDEPLFYLAGAGTYTNFGGLSVTIPRGTLAIFYYDTAWHYTTVRTDSDALFNVNQYLGAPSTTYTKANGRNAVPSALRSKGMIITYLTTNGWLIEQNLSTSGTWNADANWQTIGPVSVSQNTITIGGNYAGEVSTTYDVTLHNSGATFASLEALLSDADLATLIPTGVRCGGMSIRFIQTSDNKYVQYRYMLDDATTVSNFTNVANWQGIDKTPVAGSNNLVESNGILTKIAEYVINKDLCNPFVGADGFSVQGYITPNGDYNNTSNYHCTDYISISPDKKIYLAGCSKNQYVSLIYFYTSEKAKISGISNISNPNGTPCIIDTDDIPSTAAYIRVSSANSVLQSSYVGQLVNAKEISDVINDLSENIQDVDEKIDEETIKLNNRIDGLYVDSLDEGGSGAFKNQGYIKPDGTVYVTTNYHYTDFLEINTDNDIHLKGCSNNQYVALAYFYDANKDRIIGSQISNVGPVTAEYKVLKQDIPQGACYIRVSVADANIDTAYVKQLGKTPQEAIDEIRESIQPTLNLTIPNTIYAVVGTEVNLWNDTVSLSVDRGLQSPFNYQVRWNCNKGLITDRGFRYTPAAGDAGSTIACTCYLYDINNHLIESKTFNIKVLAKNVLNSAKNIAYFGDSLGWESASNLYNDFHNSDKFTGTIPTMIGTRGGTYKYDAVGGYGWANYATAGQTAYRASVTGVSSIGRGAVYSDGSHNFEVIEINITEGAGNILLLPHYTSSGALIMPSGTLTKVSGGGDDSIPYTDAFAESGNPLWNDSTQQLDVAQYKELCGLQATDKIDAVSFQFGINDAHLADNLTQLRTYIQSLYNAFIADNANCKVLVGLTTSAGNTLAGNGATFGASNNWMQYLDRVYRIRKFYLTLQGDLSMPNIRIAPIHLELDRYYGYGFSTRAISQRVSETEQYHNNYYHPISSGYGQIGDAYFAMFIGALTES